MALVVVSNLLAWPVMYFLLRNWLAGFAYHMELSWIYFALSGLAALVIALLTVSSQGIRAALTNPVDALRHE